jgi:hypothetical protein
MLFFCFRGIEWPSNNTFIRNYVFVPSLSADLKPKIDAIEEWREIQLTNIGRSIGINGTLFSGYRAIYKIESIDGPDALFPIYYRELTEVLQMPYGWYWRMEFSEKNIDNYSNINTLKGISKFKSLTSIKFINCNKLCSIVETLSEEENKIEEIDIEYCPLINVSGLITYCLDKNIKLRIISGLR